MFRKSARSVLVLAVLAAAGCASVPGRDVAMDDARMAVNAARSNPRVASYAPAELNQAIDTLRQAEDLAARGGRAADVQQLAVLANQRASLAQDVARTRSDEAALLVQRKANEAQATADLSRRQAESAQLQAAAAQRQAEGWRIASSSRAERMPSRTITAGATTSDCTKPG
jgi:chorismate mutase